MYSGASTRSSGLKESAGVVQQQFSLQDEVIYEISLSVTIMKFNLPFPSWLPLRVEFSEFDLRKQRFDWSSRVTIWAGVDDPEV